MCINVYSHVLMRCSRRAYMHKHVCLYSYDYVFLYICIRTHGAQGFHGVATIRRLLKIIGLFCRILFFLWGSFAKETYNFKKPIRIHGVISE